MSDYDSFQGRPLSDEYLAELGAEAERGYDVDEILRQRGGHPALGDGPSVVVMVRLDPDRIAALDDLAQRNHETRSDVIRRAVDRELALA